MNGSGDAVRDGFFQELPESASGQFDSADFIGKPDAESASATGASVAVAAEDAMGAFNFFPGASLVAAANRAVPIEGADCLAVRARHLFESFRDRSPFDFAAVKQRLCQRASAKGKGEILPQRGGVRARYDWRKRRRKKSRRGKIRFGPLYRIPSVINEPNSDDNSAIPARKCDQSEGRDN